MVSPAKFKKDNSQKLDDSSDSNYDDDHEQIEEAKIKQKDKKRRALIREITELKKLNFRLRKSIELEKEL
jgi:hypothetical protein